ncbi:MAG: hypothetical protein K2I79_04200, partial [Clostridia bacterium]|nr:hypothetical protein [Clostridia bacterium]
MKKKFLSVMFIIVVAAVLALTGVLAGCDKEKQEASIEVERKQTFIYDGQPHRLVAQLNHSECDLEYYYKNNKLAEPVFTEVGSYSVTIKAPETEHYKAPEEQRVTVVISQDLYGLLTDVMSVVDISSNDLLTYEIDTSLKFIQGTQEKNYSLFGKGYINIGDAQAKAYLEAKKENALSFGIYLDGNDI